MTSGNDRYKMIYALHMLSNVKNIGEGRYTPASKLYEISKKLFLEHLTTIWTAEKRKQHAEKIGPKVKGIKRSDSMKEKCETEFGLKKHYKIDLIIV